MLTQTRFNAAQSYENAARANLYQTQPAKRTVAPQTDTNTNAGKQGISDQTSISAQGKRIYDLIASSQTLRNIVPNYFPNSSERNGQLAEAAAREIVAEARREGMELNVPMVANMIKWQHGIPTNENLQDSPLDQTLYNQLSTEDRSRLEQIYQTNADNSQAPRQTALLAMRFNQDKQAAPDVPLDREYLDRLLQRMDSGSVLGLDRRFVASLIQ